MSRIAGLHRPADPRLRHDEPLVARMLGRFLGRSEILSGPQGAIGRVSRGGLAGGTATLGSLLVALDGRLLDADGLRADLAFEGGDAALVAALVRRHGFVAAMARITGDVAVAVTDVESGRLWLGRDRFGVKPLYWTPVAGGIAFASQPRALLAVPGVSPEPHPSFVARFAASHYRTFDNDPEASPFAAIRQLPAASVLEIAPNGSARLEVYWRLEEAGDFDLPEADLAEAYRHHLVAAVRRRVAPTERPLFTLSGGLDSSSVLCCAAEVTGASLQATSCVYTDATFDERDEIRDVVDARVSTWTPIEIGSAIDLTNLVERQVRLHDEPVATATWLPHLLLVERAAAAGADALFGGLGGDELNAGEYEYFPMHFADLRAAGREADLAHEVALWARHHDHPIHRKSPAAAEAMMAALTDPTVPGACRPDRTRMLRYAHVLQAESFDLAGFVPVMDRPFRSYLKNRAFQDLYRETLPCCLRAQDRHCNALGIESVTPFLDHDLAAFMFRVPGDLKIRDGVTKRLLREAMFGILPEATRLRVKKTGWNAPAHVWFSARTLEALRDRVSSAAFRQRGVYDPPAVLAIIDDHARIVAEGGREDNHMMFLWQLLNLDTWLAAIGDIADDAAHPKS